MELQYTDILPVSNILTKGGYKFYLNKHVRTRIFLLQLLHVLSLIYKWQICIEINLLDMHQILFIINIIILRR